MPSRGPEIYFGELTNTDVYVRTRQKEFNYPQGDTNNLTSYEGKAASSSAASCGALLIALDRGDLAKLPFSDDITAGQPAADAPQRPRPRRTLAPFLTFDPDPYIVVGDDGRLFWMMDGFTTSDTYPYSRHYRSGASRSTTCGTASRPSSTPTTGRRRSTCSTTDDPIVAAYRGIFPTLFKDASAMPAGLRKHVRYPELMLKLQAAVYGLYHMTDPEVFYNREDLWTVASEVGMNEQREQATQTMEPNFVLMKLPGETARRSSSRSCRSRRRTATT